MAVAINPNTRETYVLLEDRDKPGSERTEFIIRPITAGEFADMQRKGDAFVHDLAFLGIVGWHNLVDENGIAVPYSPEAARARLGIRWIKEIAERVARLSRLTEDDEKNSVSPQPSSAAR